MKKILVVVLAVVTSLVGKLGYDKLSDGELPSKVLMVNYKSAFWGPSNLQGKNEDLKIYPWKLQVDEKTLTELKSQLKLELSSGRLTPPLENIAFEYGFNTEYLKKVLIYWQTNYDWRAREKLLNKFPQFKTKVEGIDIHFQHVKSANNGKYRKTIPLLLLHGWPGSFVEFQKIVPLLTDPKNVDFNFELVIPSLPGYGFSEPALRPGLGTIQMAQIFLKLMRRLNHEQFYVQGGDWGSMIATHMATAYPENVIAMHSNMCYSMHPRAHLRLGLTTLFPSVFMQEDEAQKFLPYPKFFEFLLRETGYLHLQATKPDTVGVGLSLSPSGLAAYILEKFSTWTNENGLTKKDGDLTKKFTMDELLDNIMVYWVSKSITSSMRLYSENFSKKQSSFGLDRVPVKVPMGCITGRNDPYSSQTRFILQDKFPNLIRYTMAKDGGHFLGFENPEILAEDVTEFVKQVESIQEGKNA